MGKYFMFTDTPDDVIIDLNKVAGVIELLPTPDGKVCEELFKTGNFSIVPYGFGDNDENGNITNFKLIGFSINHKK